MGILKTNYRVPGAQLEIKALGGGMPLASAWGGAGQYMPYGGWMYLSWVGTIQDATGGVAANQSYAVVISTFGALSKFYGSGLYSAGFKFIPVNARVLSLTDTAFSAGARPSVLPQVITCFASGSYALVKILGYSVSAATGAAWLGTLATIAGECRIDVWGFIASGP